MGIPMQVPEPTEADFTLVKIGFGHWYEHDSECVPEAGKPEDWRNEVLSLIRLANHYKNLADETVGSSETQCQIRYLLQDENDELRRLLVWAESNLFDPDKYSNSLCDGSSNSAAIKKICKGQE